MIQKSTYNFPDSNFIVENFQNILNCGFWFYNLNNQCLWLSDYILQILELSSDYNEFTLEQFTSQVNNDELKKFFFQELSTRRIL